MQTVQEFLQTLPDSQLLQGEQHLTAEVTSVTHDSRQVQAGSIFVAFTGEHFDGHRFYADVLSKGAVALVGQKRLEELAADGLFLPPHIPYILVQESRNSIAMLAAAFHDFPSRAMTVIGITGTDGKTTTANILESILATATLSDEYPLGRVGVISTVGARLCGQESDTGLHVTTPDAPAVQQYLADMRGAGCLYAIIESTSQGIAQSRVDAVEFDVAAVTNITHEHLDWHGSREAYMAAKAGLFRMLFQSSSTKSMGRWAILNADDTGRPDYPGSYEALQAVLAEEAAALPDQVTVHSYGTAADEPRPTIWASAIAHHPDRTHFDLHSPAGNFPLESPLIGEFNVQNILCAASVALALGVPAEAIQMGVAGLTGVLGRMERIDCGQPFLALVDFAHSPASLERALLVLRQILGASDARQEQANRIIAVFGSAGLRDVEKRRLMGQISGRLADFSVITAEDPRTEDLAKINQAIAAGVQEFARPAQWTVIPDRAEAIHYALSIAEPGDIVAAFGKGHERSMCYGTTEHPWNEQETMRKALHALGYQKG